MNIFPNDLIIRTYNDQVCRDLKKILKEFFQHHEIIDPRNYKIPNSQDRLNPQRQGISRERQEEIPVYQQVQELEKILGTSISSKRHTLKDVIGLTEAKEKLKDFTQYKQVKKVDKVIGPVEKKGYVLYGHPGVGKTYLYRAIINEAKANGVKIGSTKISAASHGNKYVFGASNNILEEYLNVVRRLKVEKKTDIELIFLDEVEGLVTDRNQKDSHTAFNQVVNTFNEVIDGEYACDGIFFIGCTNHIKGIDVSFVRSGRLEPISCPFPTRDELEELFRHYHKKIKDSSTVELFGKLDFNKLTKLGFEKKFNGSDVSKIFNNAKERIRRVMIDEELEHPKSKITQAKLIDLIQNFDMLQKGQKIKKKIIQGFRGNA